MTRLLFNKGVEKYISKYRPLLDIPKNSLCTQLFAFPESTPPIMHESVRMQILRDVEQIAPYVIVRDFYATGLAFIPNATPDKTSNIIVNIEFSDNRNDVVSNSRAFNVAKKLSGRYIDRTQHRVFYKLYSKPVDLRVVTSKYDVLNNRWIKLPSSN